MYIRVHVGFDVAVHMHGQRRFVLVVTHLNRSWIKKCTFEVHGLKQNRPTSLRTAVHFTLNVIFIDF
jgi:hypothetical protein